MISLYLPTFYHFSTDIKSENSNEFTEADYDFSGVKPDELLACDFYEYARESNAVRSEIADARKQIKQDTGQFKFGSRVQNQIQNFVLISLLSVDGFPMTPWQRLSSKDRHNLLRYMAAQPKMLRFAFTQNNPPLTFGLIEPVEKTLEKWTQQCKELYSNVPESEPIKYGFFRVNMKYPHHVLILEFTEYLRHFEGKPMVEYPPVKNVVRKPRGRHTKHDALNALAAMRLRYHCDTFTEAQKTMLPLKSKKHGLFYGHRYNFNRACDAALIHFQDRFNWIDSAKPIHFTEGWQKGTHK